jgi:hypothetical protein
MITIRAWRGTILGPPLIFCSLQKPGDVGLVAVQDKGGDDDAQDEVELGVTPEESNEDRNGDRTRHRSQRNISPLPHDPREDEKLNQHGDRRDDAVNP